MLSKPLVVRRITYRLIVSYSEARVAKDLIVRTKGLARLKKTMAAGRLTKEHINNRGYNKYLKMEGHTRIHIDEESFKADGCWDGLKGYLTNTTLDAQAVMAAYGQLWEMSAPSEYRRPICASARYIITRHDASWRTCVSPSSPASYSKSWSDNCGRKAQA